MISSYHDRTRGAIEAHLTVVFTALAVARKMQRRTGRLVRDLIKRLRPLRSATICINGAQQVFPPRIDESHRRILTDLGCREGH